MRLLNHPPRLILAMLGAHAALRQLALLMLLVCPLAAQVAQVPQRKDSITVKATADDAPLDPRANAEATTLTRDELLLLPSLGNDPLAALSTLLAPSLDGDAPEIVVDGVPVKNHRIRTSQIQSITVASEPYSAEFRRPGRSRIEIFSRQPETKFHGEASILLRNSFFDARPAFAPTKAAEHRRSIEFSLGGPLSQRNSFLASGEFDSSNQQAIIFARLPNGDFRATAPVPESDSELSLRLFRKHSEASTLSFQYEYAVESALNQGIGGFTLPEAAFSQRDREQHLGFQFRTARGANLLASFTGEIGRHANITSSLNPGPRNQVEDAFTIGGAQRSEWGNETHADLSASLIHTRGNHTLRFGAALPEIARLGNRDGSLRAGALRYATLADYAANNPFQQVRREGPGLVRFWYVETAAYFQDDIRLRPNLTLSAGLRHDHQTRLNDANNFAPRASIAWSPGKARRTIIRAGAGIFYDLAEFNTLADTIRLNGLNTREVFETDTGVTTPAPNITRLARNIRSPYLSQLSAAIEHRTGPATIALTATRARQPQAFRAIDINTGRPDPNYGVIREINSTGQQSMDAIDFTARLKPRSYLQTSIQYSIAWSKGDTEDEDFLPSDSRRPQLDYGWLNNDRRHRLRILSTIRVKKQFDVGLIAQWNSGRPYSQTLGQDLNQDGQLTERAEGIARNSLRLPSEASIDAHLSRTWERRIKITASLDAMNVLNQTNISRIVGNERSPLFGQPTAARSPRRLQLGLRFSF